MPAEPPATSRSAQPVRLAIRQKTSTPVTSAGSSGSKDPRGSAQPPKDAYQAPGDVVRHIVTQHSLGGSRNVLDKQSFSNQLEQLKAQQGWHLSDDWKQQFNLAVTEYLRIATQPTSTVQIVTQPLSTRQVSRAGYVQPQPPQSQQRHLPGKGGAPSSLIKPLASMKISSGVKKNKKETKPTRLPQNSNSDYENFKAVRQSSVICVEQVLKDVFSNNGQARQQRSTDGGGEIIYANRTPSALVKEIVRNYPYLGDKGSTLDDAFIDAQYQAFRRNYTSYYGRPPPEEWAEEFCSLRDQVLAELQGRVGL